MNSSCYIRSDGGCLLIRPRVQVKPVVFRPHMFLARYRQSDCGLVPQDRLGQRLFG